MAYRLLGGVADAEDVTQDVWLRAAGTDLQDIDDLRAWLVTVAARRSYDILKSARFRREIYVGSWLPEPLLTGPDASEPVLVDESVASAMLLIMEELSPLERVAFVLHDVFGLEFVRIAEVLDVSVPGARQLASRARRRVADAKRSSPQASTAERARVLATFRAAYEAGDLAGLIRLLHPDAVYVTDRGGKVAAMRKPVRGGERVAEVMVRGPPVASGPHRPRRGRRRARPGVPPGGPCLLRGHAADRSRSDRRVPQGPQPGQTFSCLSCHNAGGHLVSLLRALLRALTGQTNERSPARPSGPAGRRSSAFAP
ncbi:sigma factor-like helix-turn-helix DNA-binding protein [Microbispora bryophytorum]|uniref:sigma factor-like helix-turn-helix DNA-binding protein n=1 Tax=Microbispora bryophytorum TaxID=1460882 RepID=UPI001E4CDB2C|nr:sigma factor-like helix-turn-helix DNA-binding protein [Microbispora bryophytorum]